LPSAFWRATMDTFKLGHPPVNGVPQRRRSPVEGGSTIQHVCGIKLRKAALQAAIIGILQAAESLLSR